jgi:hypothetical protein
MINFDRLFDNVDQYRIDYLSAKPFSYLIIDDFCDSKKLLELYSQIPELNNKSRDYMFANNKFEKSNYASLGELFKELHDDLHCEKMNEFLSFISSKDVFIDPRNHGGGLHQGKSKSRLDMHLDFNYHPIEQNWYREMNLLFYLNKDWKTEYGGDLIIQDLRTGNRQEFPVPFNRLIIQKCSSYSLHGYNSHNFPDGTYRTSIATYAYVKHINQLEKPRTTDWFPNKESSIFKKFLGKNMKHLVRIKSKLLGSGTAKNQ